LLQLAAGAAALPAVPRIARAQAYPSRTVRIVVGFPAGQAIDIFARLMAEWLQQRLGQTFIVENRPGAAANVATEMVARSPADGYTLLIISSNNVINTTLYCTVHFAREIAPIASFGRGYQVLNVNNSLPARTVAELIAVAKADPGKLSMGSPGIGSAGHVAGEMFKMMTGVSMLHVPYRGSVPALTDLMSGQIQVMFDNLPSSIEHIRAGRIRALAVTPATRSAGAARCPDHRRIGAGLRGRRLDRNRRARQHTDRDHRSAQPRGQCRARRSQDRGSAREPGQPGPEDVAR
jgi:tripartite-type tricarboxylate transporter receptor subunit TctC